MEKINLKKNYLYRLSYQILTLITPFITTPYVSRVLGADGIGINSFATSVISYFSMFAVLGTSSYGAREVSMNRNDLHTRSKLFWEIELQSIVTGGICLAVWIVLIASSNYYKYYFLAITPTLLSSIADISWFFTGLEQVKYIVVRNAAVKILGIIAIFLFIHKKEDLFLYMLIHSLFSLIGTATMWIYLPRFTVRVKLKDLQIFRHLKQTLIYFVPTIAISIYTVLDKTLLGLITKNAFENGYYSQAESIIGTVNRTVTTALNSVMGARIAFLFAEEKKDEIRTRIHSSMHFIYLFGYGCVFGIIGVSSNFVPVFFGEGYEAVITLLCVMAPLIIIIGTSGVAGAQYLTPCGKQKLAGRLLIAGSITNLLLNLLLIPKFASIGATVATLAAELLITYLFIKNCDGYLSFQYLLSISVKKITAGLVMLVVVLFISHVLPLSKWIVLICQFIIGGMIYCLLLYIQNDESLRIITARIRKKPFR